MSGQRSWVRRQTDITVGILVGGVLDNSNKFSDRTQQTHNGPRAVSQMVN